MEEMKKNQTENENMPAPKSLKKVNKSITVMTVIGLVCFIISWLLGYHSRIGQLAAFMGCGLIVISTIMIAKNRVQK